MGGRDPTWARDGSGAGGGSSREGDASAGGVARGYAAVGVQEPNAAPEVGAAGGALGGPAGAAG
ncbi:hypothetical protein SHKM778_30450 [Streptomyces sp. KM77-8]|uniref:Uncharacterized protein n=1 Tax=Streptomyces haneummycinicus TaxID=3074435 RepID=A0AAT9HGX8_9ACTN